jgi:hypothetical protein
LRSIAQLGSLVLLHRRWRRTAGFLDGDGSNEFVNFRLQRIQINRGVGEYRVILVR